MHPDQPSDQSEPSSAAADATSGAQPAPEAPTPGADPAPGAGWRPSFQVLRARQDRKLGGVAGGLAAAADLDPTLVRLAILLGCLTGWGVLAYLIAWAVIPEEDPTKGRYLIPGPEPTGKYLRIGLAVVAGLGVLHVLGAILGVVGSALIGLGLWPAHLFGIADHDGFEGGEAMLGLFLLIGGLLLIFRHHLPWMPAPDTGTGPGTGPASPGSWAPPTTPPGSVALATVAPGSGGAGAAAGSYGPPPPGPGAPGFGARASAAARVARTNGPLLLVRAAGWLVALWFLGAALVAGVFWVAGALDVRLPVLPIVTTLAAVGALGYVLVRSRRIALVLAAMALLLVPTTLAAALVRVDGQAGDRSVVPIVRSDLQREYRHAVGVLALDLSRLQLPPGRTAVDISMGAGKVEVTVPWDANVEVRATVAAGSFDLFGNRQTGVNLDGQTRSTGQPGAPLLVLAGEAGAGEIIVRRGSEPFTQQALRTGQPVPMQCNPTPSPYGFMAEGPLRCSAADGITQTPALTCVVSESGSALCRPPGEPEPVVDFANTPGTRRCQVPAGGGDSTCTAPVPGQRAQPGEAGSFTCTFPYGGGPAVCRPSGAEGPGPKSPAPPAAPSDPAIPTDPSASDPSASDPSASDPSASTPSTTATSPAAGPGEYLCTIPEGGGAATCRPV